MVLYPITTKGTRLFFVFFNSGILSDSLIIVFVKGHKIYTSINLKVNYANMPGGPEPRLWFAHFRTPDGFDVIGKWCEQHATFKLYVIVRQKQTRLFLLGFKKCASLARPPTLSFWVPILSAKLLIKNCR